LFKIFDANHDKKVDVNEFMGGFALIGKGSVEEKLKLTFNAWDSDQRCVALLCAQSSVRRETERQRVQGSERETETETETDKDRDRQTETDREQQAAAVAEEKEDESVRGAKDGVFQRERECVCVYRREGWKERE
jgi:hypothetical protein